MITYAAKVKPMRFRMTMAAMTWSMVGVSSMGQYRWEGEDLQRRTLEREFTGHLTAEFLKDPQRKAMEQQG